jgi:hypothetical protein
VLSHKGVLDPATVARLPQLADGLARQAGEAPPGCGTGGLLVHHELTAEGQRRLCRVNPRSGLGRISGQGAFKSWMYRILTFFSRSANNLHGWVVAAAVEISTKQKVENFCSAPEQSVDGWGPICFGVVQSLVSQLYGEPAVLFKVRCAFLVVPLSFVMVLDWTGEGNDGAS